MPAPTLTGDDNIAVPLMVRRAQPPPGDGRARRVAAARQSWARRARAGEGREISGAEPSAQKPLIPRVVAVTSSAGGPKPEAGARKATGLLSQGGGRGRYASSDNPE